MRAGCRSWWTPRSCRLRPTGAWPSRCASICEALAPTNFPATNPEVLRLAAESGGASLAAGLHNLEADARRGRMQMSDERAFAVGRDLAITAGAVVYENPVAQLIQYAPRTPSVHARPLLIVPPFINKYYILDLRPENSFVRFALDQGQQVFMVSWRNAGRELERATWDDYARDGVLALLEAVLDIAGADRLNALGFCVGGTLLASTLAVMPQPARVASLTLLATMLDFSRRRRDRRVHRRGVRGSLRAAVPRRWPGGGRPAGARLRHPARQRADLALSRQQLSQGDHARCLRPAVLERRQLQPARPPLRLVPAQHVPGEQSACPRQSCACWAARVDLARIRAPAYLLATREDHIVPWTSAYAAQRLLGGRIEFVLGASGHVAGVVNPPDPVRRCFWHTGPAQEDAGDWLAAARREPGSWWPHWSEWVRQHAGPRVRAPQGLGSERYPAIEAAPGRYVLEKD